MTMHQLRVPTPGETALVTQAEAGALTADRREAIVALRREGLPTRRVEAWHYTDLRALLGGKGEGADVPTPASLLAPLLPNSVVIDLDDAPPAVLPTGVHARRTPASADWKRSPNHLDRSLDTIRLVNAAFGAEATSIEIAAGASPAAPIELRANPAEGRQHSFTACDVGRNARVTVVERLTEGAAAVVPSTGVTMLSVGEGAEVLWIVDQAKDGLESHLGQLNVSVGAGATFRLFILNGGGRLVRYEVHAVTAGEGADIQLRGVNLLKAGQHVDVTTTLNHTAPGTTSTETFRNVVTGGRGVFQGMIKVARDAQKTDARMACNSLLLSDEGEFFAKPELEIFADDVQCGHGATAGEIDADHLFYLMSRGIPERAARALLVKAFVKEVVEELEHEAAIEALEQRIDAWLESN